jgi:hypothetical protein
MRRALLAVVLLTACRETHTLRWEGRFVNPADAERTRTLEAEVIEGGCAPGAGRSVYRAERMPPEALPAVPTLAEGVYGFHLRARDERCVIIAAGCTEAGLALPDGALVTTRLEPSAETAPCPLCVAGGCADLDSGVELPDAGTTLPSPTLRWPWHGWASGADLTPRLRWEPVDGATHYEVELDDGCDRGPATQACFDAPIVLRTAGTEITPSELAIGAAPIGRRYQWRVRACDGPMDDTASCSFPSPARWIDVGRSDADFDGDGDGDLLAGAPTVDATFTDQGAAYVFDGDAAGLSETPSRTIDHPDPDGDGWFGSAVSVGDIDGDGYADAVIGAEEDDGGGETDSGLAYVVFGSSSGLSASRIVTLAPGTADASAYFGQSVAIVGDVDGDGDRDIVVGAGMTDIGGTDVGIAYFYRGARENMASTPALTLLLPAPSDGAQFGMTVAAAGDVDGDGFPDVIIGAPYENACADPPKDCARPSRSSRTPPRATATTAGRSRAETSTATASPTSRSARPSKAQRPPTTIAAAPTSTAAAALASALPPSCSTRHAPPTTCTPGGRSLRATSTRTGSSSSRSPRRRTTAAARSTPASSRSSADRRAGSRRATSSRSKCRRSPATWSSVDHSRSSTSIAMVAPTSRRARTSGETRAATPTSVASMSSTRPTSPSPRGSSTHRPAKPTAASVGRSRRA